MEEDEESDEGQAPRRRMPCLLEESHDIRNAQSAVNVGSATAAQRELLEWYREVMGEL